MFAIQMRDLCPGEFFTLKPISEPKENQVYIRGSYDRSEKKYVGEKFSDISSCRYIKGDTLVYTGFTF